MNADTTTLALHVLTAVEFGKRYAFEGGVGEVGVGHKMSYRDALQKVLGNLFGVILTMSFLPKNLPRWVIPGPVKRIQEAVGEFKAYMREMVQEEREAIESGSQGKDNLMSVLLRAADAEAEKDGNGRSGLSDEEIYGNLFFYNLAGQDTSANTLAYAITMLATNPKWQEWIGEEITSVFAGKDNVEEWEYEDAFPKLKRCLALMVNLYLSSFQNSSLNRYLIVRNPPRLRSRSLHPQIHRNSATSHRSRKAISDPDEHLHLYQPPRHPQLTFLGFRRPSVSAGPLPLSKR